MEIDKDLYKYNERITIKSSLNCFIYFYQFLIRYAYAILQYFHADLIFPIYLFLSLYQ